MDLARTAAALPALLQPLAQSAGTVLLVGDTDTGKTTLAAALANVAFALGRRVAVVDADIGQSEIGPPATVGLGLLTRPVGSLGELCPVALAFVGATSAGLAVARHIESTRQMVRTAHESGAGMVVVDTTGYVRGAAAVRLKRAKIAAVRPDCVVALCRGDECAALVATLRHSSYTKVLPIAIPAELRVKSAAVRARRRAEAFRRALAGAEERTFDLGVVRWIEGGPCARSRRASGVQQPAGRTGGRLRSTAGHRPVPRG